MKKKPALPKLTNEKLVEIINSQFTGREFKSEDILAVVGNMQGRTGVVTKNDISMRLAYLTVKGFLIRTGRAVFIKAESSQEIKEEKMEEDTTTDECDLSFNYTMKIGVEEIGKSILQYIDELKEENKKFLIEIERLEKRLKKLK
jgi:hypothetical protein